MTPQELATEAACYSCIPRGLSPAVITYLLNQIAATGLTPEQLMEQAKCFACIPPGSSNAVNAFLLNYIADNCGGGGGTGILEGAATIVNLVVDGINPGTTELEIQATSILLFLFWTNQEGVEIARFTNLVSVGNDPSQDHAITGWTILLELYFPSLTTVNGTLSIDNSSLLEIIDLSALVSVTGAYLYITNPSLSELDLSSFVPQDGLDIYVINSDLNDTSVNQVLARCVANPAYVSGSVDLSGGTNSPPTGQGILDAATLAGRGVTVTTN